MADRNYRQDLTRHDLLDPAPASEEEEEAEEAEEEEEEAEEEEEEEAEEEEEEALDTAGSAIDLAILHQANAFDVVGPVVPGPPSAQDLALFADYGASGSRGQAGPHRGDRDRLTQYNQRQGGDFRSPSAPQAIGADRDLWGRRPTDPDYGRYRDRWGRGPEHPDYGRDPAGGLLPSRALADALEYWSGSGAAADRAVATEVEEERRRTDPEWIALQEAQRERERAKKRRVLRPKLDPPHSNKPPPRRDPGGGGPGGPGLGAGGAIPVGPV